LAVPAPAELDPSIQPALIVGLPAPKIFAEPAPAELDPSIQQDEAVAEPLLLQAPEIVSMPARDELAPPIQIAKLPAPEIFAEPAPAELEASIQPAEAMVISSSEDAVSNTLYGGAIQVDDFLENQGHESEEIYGTVYPTLGEIKVPA
jgi:hypothetical protein